MSRSARSGRSLDFGILLLLYHVIGDVGLSKIPPTTLLSVVGMATIFTGHFDPGWGIGNFHYSALDPYRVFHAGEFYRLFTAAVQHGSDLHLYYNMASHSLPN